MPVPPLSPIARRALLAASINALGNGFTLPFLLVYLHTVRGVPLSLTGLVIATIGAAGLALSPLAGTAIDRFGPRRVQLASLLILTAGALYLTQVQSTAQAFLAAAVIGVGHTGSWPSMNALLAAVSAPEQRQRLFALEFTLINAGIGVGGVAGGFLADVSRPGTFQLLYLIDAATYVLAGAVLVTLRSAGGPVAKPVDAHGAEQPGGWGEVLRDHTMRWLCLLYLIVVLAGYAQIDAGFPAFATGVSGVSTRVLGIAFAVNTSVIVLGQLFVLGRLEGHRRTRAMAGFAALIAVSWTLFGVSGLIDGLAAATLVVVSMGIFAAGETLWSPTGNALVNDLAPAHLRGRYNALAALMWQIAMMIGPIFSSAMLDADLVWSYIAVLVAASAVAIALALRLERRLTPAQNGLFPVPAAAAPHTTELETAREPLGAPAGPPAGP